MLTNQNATPLLQTNFNILQRDIFSTLFSLCLGENLSSSIVLNQLWHINPQIIVQSFMDIHLKDPSSISKIADACQEIKVRRWIHYITIMCAYFYCCVCRNEAILFSHILSWTIYAYHVSLMCHNERTKCHNCW